jgi:hypothetical protein
VLLMLMLLLLWLLLWLLLRRRRLLLLILLDGRLYGLRLLRLRRLILLLLILLDWRLCGLLRLRLVGRLRAIEQSRREGLLHQHLLLKHVLLVLGCRQRRVGRRAVTKSRGAVRLL